MRHAENRRIVACACANRLLKRELILFAIHPNVMYSLIGMSIFVCARSVVLCQLFTLFLVFSFINSKQIWNLEVCVFYASGKLVYCWVGGTTILLTVWVCLAHTPAAGLLSPGGLAGPGKKGKGGRVIFSLMVLVWSSVSLQFLMLPLSVCTMLRVSCSFMYVACFQIHTYNVMLPGVIFSSLTPPYMHVLGMRLLKAITNPCAWYNDAHSNAVTVNLDDPCQPKYPPFLKMTAQILLICWENT